MLELRKECRNSRRLSTKRADVKKNQLELLDLLNGNKNRPPGINSKQEEVKEWISNLEDGVMGSNQAEQ